MTAHDWYVENLVAYATRTLESKDEALFANHLPRCEECRRAVADLERELAWLPMGVVPAVPRPGLTRQLVEGALRKRPARWWQWTAALATVAALLVVGRAWTDARSRIAGLREELAASQGQLSAIKDSLSIFVGAERVLQETVRRRGYEGGLLIFYDQDTERWNVVVHGLPPAGRGQAYHLWYVTNSGLLPGPELHPNGARPTFLTLPAPDSSRDVVGAMLSVGPPDGVSAARGIELARVRF